jgi:peptidoglycan LD-endopeptidase CwlK
MALRRLTDAEVTPAITAEAVKLRNTVCRPENIGHEYPFEADGAQFVGRIERHYHPPGGATKPWGPHPGVSVFRVVADAPAPVVPPHAPFILGARSNSRLQGVHIDLVRVVRRCIEITPIDFTVVEGLRPASRQKELVAAGKSQTLKSRHLTGHAVDLAPYEGGIVHWDWPRFRLLAGAMDRAALDCGVPVEWGGNWPGFPDGPHWQLPWKEYP